MFYGINNGGNNFSKGEDFNENQLWGQTQKIFSSKEFRCHKNNHIPSKNHGSPRENAFWFFYLGLGSSTYNFSGILNEECKNGDANKMLHFQWSTLSNETRHFSNKLDVQFLKNRKPCLSFHGIVWFWFFLTNSF